MHRLPRTTPSTPRARRPAAALLALLALLAGCGGGERGAEDPFAAQRERLEQQGRALGIPDGFPGPQDTGVPLGTRLEPSGSITVTEDGRVLEGLDVDGCVSVKADDVVIRNVRIRCGGKQRAVVVEGSDRGLVVEDSEIDGLGTTEVAVGWSGYTLRRVDVHSLLDGPRLGSGVTVEDSWVHDMVRAEGFHGDALQSNGGSGIVVRGNTLVPTDTSTGDVLNAAVQLGAENDSGKLSDVLIEGNYLDGGNYAVNVRGDDGISGVVLRENVFGDGSRYGPVIGPGDKVQLAAGNRELRSQRAVELDEP
ncbi:right-handed parallel beta-helix repeat-containing protein [Kineococcus indalonis]|uniref:hypothetical protein n=1 Tax=Kineococcus indalonis TaxID=2696566 RepID=UPI0014125D93|nr:hypothetical protein [Kineococcus indalonis]NAZ86847.1 hypothetical protein [Kineococcus indalonis]